MGGLVPCLWGSRPHFNGLFWPRGVAQSSRVLGRVPRVALWLAPSQAPQPHQIPGPPATHCHYLLTFPSHCPEIALHCCLPTGLPALPCVLKCPAVSWPPNPEPGKECGEPRCQGIRVDMKIAGVRKFQGPSVIWEDIWPERPGVGGSGSLHVRRNWGSCQELAWQGGVRVLHSVGRAWMVLSNPF